MTLHDLKDIVDIYYSDGNGGKTYEWDKTPIVVWNPEEQRKMDIYFTGSSRPGVESEDDLGQINFNVRYLDGLGDNCVFDAFDAIIGQIIESRFDMSVDWKKRYLETILEKRKEAKK